jgi:hypothetical protein
MHLNGQDATPWTLKLLIFKCSTGSQAGRRASSTGYRIDGETFEMRSAFAARNYLR